MRLQKQNIDLEVIFEVAGAAGDAVIIAAPEVNESK